MTRFVLAATACLLLAQGVALARPARHAHGPARARQSALYSSRANRVPLGTDTGAPGSANSANPAPNVSPLQTPQDPLRGPKF